MKLTDDYEINTYQPLKIRNSFNRILPLVGFNPDSGVNIGFANTYTYNGFGQNPFTQQHTFNASYFSATSGFEIAYKAEFANTFGKANLEIATEFTTPNFAINFFGLGNETENFDDILNFDYNRVRLGTVHVSPSVVWRGALGSTIRTGVSYEAIEVEETANRFINTVYQMNGEETQKSFVGLDFEYGYDNSDNPAFPTSGMATSIHLGYKTENGGEGSFGYVIPSLSFNYKLIPNGNSDLRLSLGKLKTGILPTALGVYGGFDYGRVWRPDETSNVWHTSYGGGFFLDVSGLTSIRAAIFNSEEGMRISFGLGFGF